METKGPLAGPAVPKTELGKSQAGCLSDLWACLQPVAALGSLRNNESLARSFQVGYQFVLLEECFILFVIPLTVHNG